jgi:hypothetical protein
MDEKIAQSQKVPKAETQPEAIKLFFGQTFTFE